MNAKFYKNFFVLLSGTTLAQVIPFVIAPIISRLYSPMDFGEYALYTSLLSLLSIIGTLKYEMAIILPKNKSESQYIVYVCLYIAFGVFILSFLASLFSYFVFKTKWIYLTLAFGTLFFSFNLIFDRVLNRNRNYTSMSILKVLKSSSESSINLLGFLPLFKNSNLVLANILGYLISNLYLLKKEGSLVMNSIQCFSIKKSFYILKKYKNFPLFSLPHTFINSLSTSLPIFLIPYYFSSDTLGLYTFGLKYVLAPLTIISGAVYNILSQEFADIREEKALLKERFNQSLLRLSIISLLFFPILLYCEEIFSFVFGSQWSTAGQYVAILSPWIVLSFIISSFAIIPIIFEKQKLALYFEALYSIAKVVPFVIGCGVLNWDFKTTLIFYTTLSSLVLLVGFLWYRKLING